jgi:hypothetical protein
MFTSGMRLFTFSVSDFNAKICSGAAIGKFALSEQNDNGERLIQFAHYTVCGPRTIG